MSRFWVTCILRRDHIGVSSPLSYWIQVTTGSDVPAESRLYDGTSRLSEKLCDLVPNFVWTLLQTKTQINTDPYSLIDNRKELTWFTTRPDLTTGESRKLVSLRTTRTEVPDSGYDSNTSIKGTIGTKSVSSLVSGRLCDPHVSPHVCKWVNLLGWGRHLFQRDSETFGDRKPFSTDFSEGSFNSLTNTNIGDVTSDVWVTHRRVLDTPRYFDPPKRHSLKSDPTEVRLSCDICTFTPVKNSTDNKIVQETITPRKSKRQ